MIALMIFGTRSTRNANARKPRANKRITTGTAMSESEQINGETYASLLRHGASRGLGLQAGEVATFPNHRARLRIRGFAVASFLIGGSLLLIGMLI